MEKFTLHDQHVHCEYSMDSEEKIENYLKIAVAKGCKYFVTTDHLDLDINDSGVDWRADYIGEYQYLASIQKDYPSLKLLIGIEVGYKINLLDKIKKIAKEVDFDTINLSVHDYQDVDFYYYDNFEKHGIDNIMHIYFDKELEAMEMFDDFDVLCHIDFAFKTLKKNHPERKIQEYEDQLIKIFKELVKRDKVLEVNTKVQETIHDDDHLRYLLKLYKECGGVHLTLSSDAHSQERYLANFDYYKNIIKECGFDHLCYFVQRKRYLYEI